MAPYIWVFVARSAIGGGKVGRILVKFFTKAVPFTRISLAGLTNPYGRIDSCKGVEITST